MAYRLVNFYSSNDIDSQRMESIQSIEGLQEWNIKKNNNDVQYSFLVELSKTQQLTDKLQPILNEDASARIVVLPVVTTIPSFDKEDDKTTNKKGFGLSREELYTEVAKGAELDKNFTLLVFFSTIVAAIGLLENNVAVVIGAMVIAPLLGPNLAFSLATVLGDTALMEKAARTNFIGLGFAFLISVLLGFFWPAELLQQSHEFMARTNVGFDGIVLAIASGAAAVLSLVTGVSTVLVGVMVAVALLPPTVVFGVSFGAGEFSYAFGAFLLLAANVICVNLSAMWIFIYKGIQPRTWQDKKQAKLVSSRYLALWLGALFVVMLLLIVRSYIVR